MTHQEIRAHIFLTLAKLYEDPLRRRQYKRFTFDPEDERLARDILAKLVRSLVVEQIQPWVVHLTDIGYKLIQPDLAQLRTEEVGKRRKFTAGRNISPPTPEEIEDISNKLGQADYINATLFTLGRSEIFWATKGIKKVTGYSLEELNKAGGSMALIRGTENLKKLEEMEIHFRGMALPQTREEFESRAALLQLMKEMERYLLLKHSFKGLPKLTGNRMKKRHLA
jgi:hypothetical protein